VRIVVPEAYGFKSIKWLSHVVLTNLPHANDTYADQGNDVDSPLKTFAATLSVPTQVKAGQGIPLSGYAQVGIGGLSKVQVWMHPEDAAMPPNDPYHATAPWRDMDLLPAPTRWGGDLPGGRLPLPIAGFDSATGRPRSWPMRLCQVHWAGLYPGLAAGVYTVRCRSVDESGNGQPMPRPFRKSGHAAIEQVALVVK
jgi:DMSO/TMAO reductase YedYZ molybdopterin-dependent catalytic subunit